MATLKRRVCSTQPLKHDQQKSFRGRLVPEAVLRRPKVTHNGIVSDPDMLQLLVRFAANARMPAAAPAPSPESQYGVV